MKYNNNYYHVIVQTQQTLAISPRQVLSRKIRVPSIWNVQMVSTLMRTEQNSADQSVESSFQFNLLTRGPSLIKCLLYRLSSSVLLYS